jgi:hypothetical protein
MFTNRGEKMAADPDAARFEARFERMETTMRAIEKVQTELRSEQTWIKWYAGAVITVLVAVTVMFFNRSFVLSDDLSDVKVDTATIRVIAEKDIAAIASEVRAIRADLALIGDAVGAKLHENRAELTIR